MSGQNAPSTAAPPPTSLSILQRAVTAAGAKYLAQMLVGPNAAFAISALGQVLVGDSQATADDIAAEIQKGGASLNLSIQDAEQQCLARLGQAYQGVQFANLFPAPSDLTQTELDNTKDARQRQIKLNDETNMWLAIGVSFGFFALILLIIVVPLPQLPDSEKDLLFTLLGVVATGWANIIGFYFGSSAGSQQKSQTITAALNQAIKSQGS